MKATTGIQTADGLSQQAPVDRAPAVVFFLPLGVFLLHAMDEIPGFASWATRHFGHESTEAFVAYHIPLVLLVSLFSWRAARANARQGWIVAISACQWQFGVNAVFHLAAWAAFGEYSPGAFTGAVVSLPVTVFYFTWLHRGKHATTRGMWISIGVGTLVAVVAIGFLFI